MHSFTRKDMLIKLGLLFGMVFGIILLSNLVATNAQAKDAVFTKKYHVYYDNEDEEYYDFEYDFHISKSKILYFEIAIERKDHEPATGDEILSFGLYRKDDEINDYDESISEYIEIE